MVADEMGAAAEDSEEPHAAAARPRRRALVTTLVVIGTLAAFLAVIAVWANRQALNTGNWADTSTQLLESPAIRTAVSGYLVDQAYENFDVTGELRGVLPKQAKPLAGPAASGLRDLAQKGIDELLQRPAIQTLWKQANRQAHARLMDVLNGGGNGISTQNGTVTLDLGSLLQQTANGIGVGQQAAQKVGPGTAQITILHSDQLKTAQDAVRVLRALPIVLLAVMLLCFGAAIGLAGRRREAVRSIGVGLIVSGIAALIARTVAGHAVVNALATTEAARPAAQDAWSIGTSQLLVAAESTIAYGVVVVIGAWLAGPTQVAVSARSAAAPYLRDPRIAWGGLAALMLIVIVWRPTPATHNAVAVLAFTALLAIGLEALRRQTAREHPDATLAAASAAQRDWFERMRGSASAAVGRAQERLSQARQSASAAASGAASRPAAGAPGAAPAAPPPAPAAAAAPSASEQSSARIDALERLARLRDAGVLDEQEFAAEKRRLLAQPPPSVP
jgi:putative oligomerization/nucleic acid binding protein